ncbi:uncharacterized protein si:dkey-262k9.2 isoform X2 [Lates japonicus]|uniref:Transmembrane protein n=1 Tax=Lates japonicus TaxID=270547 RepID=A0AAD3RAT0_LATJO|nr:uncharacterized protein AKAME5_001514800 [Lates japonicus]
MAPTKHLKMMRLLFVCLLLLLPAATAVSEESEGSADDEIDDEDLYATVKKYPNGHAPGSSMVDKTTGEAEKSDQLTLIVIVVAVAVVALSVAVIVAVLLVRRHMHSRQQGVYSVPAEQDQKGAV